MPRTDPAAFTDYNKALAKSPRYVIRIAFDAAETDVHYFTSHSDALLPSGLSASDYTHSVIQDVSGTTQRLKPDEARATIGKISFDMVDVDGALSTLFNTKLTGGAGLRDKTVRVYVGYDELTSWDDYILVQTQIVESVSYNKAVYSIQCADVQRKLKDKIFTDVKTNITQTVTDDPNAADYTTINVLDTSIFTAVEHGTSYSDTYGLGPGDDGYDASDEYIYILIDKEVIRCPNSGVTATTFTNVKRGALGTAVAKHEIKSDAQDNKQPEAKEYVYLEMPAPKLALAILTGALYNQGGATLPSGWNLGVSASFVQTSAFTTIGTDWWDPSDDTQGIVVRFAGLEETDGKAFIERELMLLLGAYMPVQADGALSMRRMTGVLANASHSAVLNSSVITRYGQLTHNMKDVLNRILIRWNYDDIRDTFTRSNLLLDATSRSLHGDAELTTLKFKGLHGSRFTQAMLAERFNSLRDRYAGPPLEIQVTTHLSQNTIEIGDVVRLQLDEVRDYTGSITSIDRAFEVQGVTIDWVKGTVTLSLFGSSQAADVLDADTIVGETGASAALPDAFYTSAGTDISTLPGFSLVGSIGHLTSNVTLTGGSDITSAGSIWYYDGDLTIDSGVTVAVENNVQLRVKGFFQVDGAIDGNGNGNAGTASSRIVGEDLWNISDFSSELGTSGIGQNSSGEGATLYTGLVGGGTSNLGYILTAQDIDLGYLSPSFSGSTFSGLPTDLRGSSGGAGGPASYFSDGNIVAAVGGDGGASGAGLLIICRGMSFGASGSVDLSGADGLTGASAVFLGVTLYAGSGAGGAAGGAVVLLDGVSSLAPLTTKFTMLSGAAPLPGVGETQICSPEFYVTGSTYIGCHQAAAAVNMRDEALRIQYLIGQQTAQEDIAVYADTASALTLTEYTNTPKSPAGNLSSIEASVTAPSDTNYSYSNIYYRVNGQSAWTLIGPDAPEAVVTVASDGTTYNFQARAVSISGNETFAGLTADITVSNVVSPTLTDTDPANLSNLAVPNVNGLELFEQGNNAEFTGRDAKFAWRKTSLEEFIEIGAEPTGLGADYKGLDQYFRDYRVRIYDGATLLREELTTDNFFIYTYEKNAEDYYRINAAPGAYREFRCEVVMRVRYTSRVSERTAKLTVSNPAPEAPTGLSLRATFQTLYLDFNLPTDTDYRGALVWLGTSSGFTRNSASLVTPDNGIIGNKLIIDKTGAGAALSSGTTYYVVIQTFDDFGLDGTESVELSATTIRIDGQYDIESQSIKTAQIGLAQITNALVNDMAVDKLTSGNFTGKYINITSGGNIRGGQTAYDTGTGFWIGDDSGTPKFSLGDSTGNKLLWTGAALSITGEITGSTITGGTIRTAASGQRVEILGADNEVHFYGDRGDTTVEELATIGISSALGDSIIILAGSTQNKNLPILARRKQDTGGLYGTAVWGYTTISATGVLNPYAGLFNAYGVSPSSGVVAGVRGEADDGLAGVLGVATGTTRWGVSAAFDEAGGGEGPLRLQNSTSASAPTHTAGLGTLWVTSAGVLYINTSGSTTWQKVGAQ